MRKRLFILLVAMTFAAAPEARAMASSVQEGAAQTEDHSRWNGDPVAGGSYYLSCRPDFTAARFLQILEHMDQTLLRPGREPREDQIVTGYLRLVLLLSGVDRIERYTASSFAADLVSEHGNGGGENAIPPAGSSVWSCNTRLLEGPEDVPLFRLFDGGEPLEASGLAELPENTLFAIRFHWDPQVVLDVLKDAPANGGAVRESLKGMTGMEPEAFAKTMCGCWEFIAVSDGNDLICRIAVPDEQGKVYDVLKVLCETAEGEDSAPVLIERKGTRTFYCSRKDKKELFAPPPGKRLGDTPLFRGALKALPRTRGTALGWINLGPGGLTCTVPPDPGMGPDTLCWQGLSVIRRAPKGVICWEVSTQDLNCESLYVLTPLFIKKLRECAEPSAASAEENGSNAQTPAPVSAADPSREAADLLKTAHRILRQEAEAKQGHFPDEARAAELLGEKMLRHFCYVPGWARGANGKLPLLIQRPGDGQGDVFLVLTVDGTCQLIRLEDYRSLKRAAGELHSRFCYSEQEFIRLVRQAAEADRRQNSAPPGAGK